MSIFTRFAAKILDFDHTALPEQQFAMIQDMLASRSFEIKGREARELLSCLKRKHLVNSITVRRLNDEVVLSSSGNGSTESQHGTDLMNFAAKSFAGTDLVTTRSEKEWVMLMPWQNSLYIVKANSSLSGIELKALAKEIESILGKKRLS
jgi:hypothetical protein